MAAHHVRIRTVGPGHYTAEVKGVPYEMVKTRRQEPPWVTWELYRLVDGQRELVEQALTLEANRNKLDELAGPPAPLRLSALRWQENDYLHELKVSLEIAFDQAKRLDAMNPGLTTTQAVGIAMRAVAVALQQVVRRADVVIDEAAEAEELEAREDDPQLELVGA